MPGEITSTYPKRSHGGQLWPFGWVGDDAWISKISQDGHVMTYVVNIPIGQPPCEPKWKEGVGRVTKTAENLAWLAQECDKVTIKYVQDDNFLVQVEFEDTLHLDGDYPVDGDSCTGRDLGAVVQSMREGVEKMLEQNAEWEEKYGNKILDRWMTEDELAEVARVRYNEVEYIIYIHSNGVQPAAMATDGTIPTYGMAVEIMEWYVDEVG